MMPMVSVTVMNKLVYKSNEIYYVKKGQKNPSRNYIYAQSSPHPFSPFL